MHNNRLSAVQSVHQQPRQSLGLCCNCLKQPRRIRPIPFKSREFEMVETRPRRRIRVIHLLPSKKAKAKNDATVNSVYSPYSLFNSHGSQEAENTRRLNIIGWDGFSKNGSMVVRAEIEKHESTAQNIEYDDDLDDRHSDYAIPESGFLSVYGFESAFHPKNYFDSEEDVSSFGAQLKVYAEQLVHQILDDAFLEFSALWGLILPDDNGTKIKENGYVVNCECNSDTWSTCETRSRFEYDLDRISGKLPAWCTSSWERELDNSFFQTSSTEMDSAYRGQNSTESQIGNGYNHDFTSSSLPYMPRTWHRISMKNFKSSFRSKHSAQRANEDIEPVDPLAKFTYHPTGDDTASQPESSFKSSTWGSSTNSSLRYIRRFTSKKYKTKPLMLFIHGIGDSAELWQNQLNFFQEHGYETLAMDLIGHGMSCAPSEQKAYTFHAILTDVLIIFDRYSKDRNIVIGHSYGACFAAALARHRPKQVTHLILLSGGGPFPLCPQPSKLCLPEFLTSCFQTVFPCGKRRKIFYVPSRKQTRLIQSLDIPSYVLKHITKGQVWLEGDASFHKQITIPTLLIYGLRDQYVTLVEECEMEKTIPRAFLELIPEASHMIMLDAPDQVNDMIYKFLRRWGR